MDLFLIFESIGFASRYSPLSIYFFAYETLFLAAFINLMFRSIENLLNFVSLSFIIEFEIFLNVVQKKCKKVFL